MQWRMLNLNNSQQIQQTRFVFFIGTLAAPANLKAVYTNTTTIHLRWNAPFSLQNISGTNKPDILGYHLQITNQNTGDVTRVNTTTTEYILLVDGDCITYEARVCAINVVGEGDLGESVTMTSLGGKEHSVKLYHLISRFPITENIFELSFHIVHALYFQYMCHMHCYFATVAASVRCDSDELLL